MSTQNGKTAVPDEVREAMARAMRDQPNGWRIDENAMLDAALSALAAAGWVCVPVEVLRALSDRLAFFPVCESGGCNTLKVCACATIDDASEELRALLSASQAKEQAP